MWYRIHSILPCPFDSSLPHYACKRLSRCQRTAHPLLSRRKPSRDLRVFDIFIKQIGYSAFPMLGSNMLQIRKVIRSSGGREGSKARPGSRCLGWAQSTKASVDDLALQQIVRLKRMYIHFACEAYNQKQKLRVLVCTYGTAYHLTQLMI